MAHDLTPREQLLIKLWNENKTQREIALELGVTIGAVSGMAMRLKTRGIIKPKSHDQVVAACQRKAAEPPKVVALLIIVEPEPIVIPEPPAPIIVNIPDEERRGVDIDGLTQSTCRWVLPHRGETGLPLYCGDEVYHRSFCQHHAARAFQIPGDWRTTSTPYKRLQAVITTR